MKQNRVFKLAYVFYALVLLIHLGVIFKVIPYTWINGGRSETYDMQLGISLTSIVLVVIGFIYVYIAQKNMALHSKKLFIFIKWFIVVMWTLSLAVQFLGTLFEKTISALILLLGVYAHYQIARMKENESKQS